MLCGPRGSEISLAARLFVRFRAGQISHGTDLRKLGFLPRGKQEDRIMTRKTNLLVTGIYVASTAIGAAAPTVVSAQGGPAEREQICHQTGSGRYQLLTVNGNAIQAHLRHGDARPGDTVADGTLNQNCQVQQPETIRVESPPLLFGPFGWGGWSCPAGTTAVGGGYEPPNATVQISQIAAPGSVFPHHTFGPQETGWVVQNGPFGQALTVYVICQQ